MSRGTWKSGSRFLDEKGPGFAILLFMAFMSAILFWPHGLNVNMAEGKEPEVVRFEKIRTSYSESAAELMRFNEDMFSRSLSILDAQRYYCLMREHLAEEQARVLRSKTLSRYQALCEIFSDAAAMVDTYAERLDRWGSYYPELHEFSLYSRGRERPIGPFLTQGECIEIAVRLARVDEHTSNCMPYGQSHQASLMPGKG